jgi:hypothetical protein
LKSRDYLPRYLYTKPWCSEVVKQTGVQTYFS